MSDFLFSTRRRAPGELRRHLEAYLAPVTAECVEHHGEWGSLAVALGPHDPSNVVMVDDEGWLSVLVGEPTVRIDPEPAGLSWRGDRRRAVHHLLKTGGMLAWDDHLDGQFAALSVDTRTGAGLLLTDLLSFIPVFVAETRDADGTGLVLGTHVDAVAGAAGRGGALDPVSAADLVTTLCIAYPHTLYAGVEQAPPGTARSFGPEGWIGPGRAYWTPAEREPFSSLAAAAEVLHGGLAADVRAACDGADRVGLLLSGGEDSRTVLGAVPPGVRVRAFVFADRENRELRVARGVARAHGAEVVVGWRTPEHYTARFAEVAALVGSHQLFMDVHGYGFHRSLGISELPVVLGGFSADSLLKGDYAGDAEGPVRLPVRPGLRAELVREAERRHEAHRLRVAGMRPDSSREWYRLWPFSMRKHAANVHGNRRLFRAHEAFHCNAVVRVAAETPQRWKRRRALFVRAVRPFLARTWHVPHTEYRFPYFGAAGNALLVPALAAARGVRALATGEVRARQRGWPRWGQVADSPGAARLRADFPLLDSPLRGLFTADSEAALDQALREHWPAMGRMAVLQLAFLASKAPGR